MGDLLMACGFGVVACESATQLLETPHGDEPACILLDVQMAGLSGPQLQVVSPRWDAGCPSSSSAATGIFRRPCRRSRPVRRIF